MSKKVNKKRQAYAEKQQKQGQNVVLWIIAGLILLALVYCFYSFSIFS